MKKIRNFSFKAIALLIAVSILLSTLMIGFTFTAESDSSLSNVWSGNVATGFEEGEGTSAKPYLIANGEQLAFMIKGGNTSGKYYKLTNDIYLNDVSKENWTSDSPKSWYNRNDVVSVPFEGNFNGGGYTVYGLYYNSNNYSGLFPNAKNATITDLTISNSSVTSSWVASGMVGLAAGTITINRCIIDDTVKIACTDTSDPNNAVAAGFVGYNSPKIYIDNSAVTASITSTNGKKGAFIGNCWGNTIADRKITNSFSAVNAPMTGHKNNSITVEKCYNVGTEALSYSGNVNKVSSPELMKGAAAKENMPSLNWKTWKTTAGYPVVKVFDPNGTKGEVWSGGIAEKYAGGSGTQGDPYLIETPEQLARMVGYDVLTNQWGNINNGSANKYYKLIADIYLNDVSSDNWYQASGVNKWYSSATSRFCGNFDGDGYVIYGLYTDSNDQYCGLFPVADAWSQDRYFNDITISDSYLVTSNNSAFVGAIAGRIYSGNNKTVYFNNCYVTDSVIFSGTSQSEYWGGLVGYAHPNSSSFFSLTACAVLAKIPTDCAFTGAESPNGTVVISNSFSACNKWVKGIGASLTDCYSVSDINTIKGTAAKEVMPNLAWDYIWKTTQNSYPIYYNRDYDLNGTVGGIWSGLTAIDYAGGSGIETDPYKIATAEQFVKMLKDANSFDTVNNRHTYYELISDIKFNDTSIENWKENARAWASVSNRFKGIFDGKGHTVTGIYYDGNGNNIGLFGVAQNAVIKNVILDNSYIKSTGYGIGGFVGQAVGSIDLNECYVGENVYIESAYEGNDAGAGGLVGYGGAAIKVNGCAFLGTVKATKFAGAILGNCWGKKENQTSNLIVNNTFSTSDIKFCTKMGLATESDNNYSVCTDDESGVITVTIDKLKGEDAMETMSGLDWGRLWKITENSYPVCQFTDDAGSPEGIWSGNIAESYAGGDGSEDTPYLIENGEQLALMITDDQNEGKHYKLTADIRLNDTTAQNWRYFGRQWVWTSNVFKGTFDGDGHKITGLYYNGTKSKVGLFAYAYNTVVKNLIIDESFLQSTGFAVGSVIGDANGGQVTLSGCYVGEKVNVTSTYNKGGDAGAGGLIGYGGAVISVEGSAFLGKVSAPSNAGSLIGNCWAKNENGASAVFVKHCYSPLNMRICSKQDLNYKSDNNYSGFEESESYVSCINPSKMTGASALSNMPKLDWGRYWKINDSGYPVCRFGDVVSTPDGIWSGIIADGYASGSGTKEDPYLISNGEQLALMVNDTNNSGKYYKLSADIILNDTSVKDWTLTAKQWNWTDNVFSGNLDGDGHKIIGLYYNGLKSKVALLCYVADATISNIIIDNSYLHSDGYAVSSIVGDANSGKVTLKQCYVGTDVLVESAFTADSNVGAGGLIGYGGAAITVEGSAFLGQVKAPQNAGAILGNCWGKTENGSSALLINDTFSNSELSFCSKQSLNGASDNNYSASEETLNGVIFVKAANMQGKKAATNLNKLDWGKYWKSTVSGYPVCRFGDINTSGGIWSGEIAESFAGGSGTIDDPYLIENGEQLALMASAGDSEGKYYKLTSDIKLNDTSSKDWKKTAKHWNWSSNIFSGYFNGDGHKITGLYYNGLLSKVGLFCYAANAEVKYVIMDDVYISSNGYGTGAIIGDANSGKVLVEECYVGENVYIESNFDVDSNAGAGGIVGYGGAAVTVNASAFLGQVKAPKNAGAILGNCWGKDATTGSSALVVKNSLSSSELSFCSKQSLSSYSDNNYSAYPEAQTGVIFIKASEMQGKDAINNMSALDWGRHWKLNDSGYPVCRFGNIVISDIAWTGDIADNYESGTGTKEDPYIIMNGEQLAKMVLDSENEGKYYKLGADIYLNDTTSKNWKDTAKQWIWTNNVFKGTFDGDTKVIRGLYYNGTKSKIGLFCYVSNATIRRVVLEDAYICSTGYATGSIIGDANSGTVLVEECYVGENVYVESKYDADGNVGAGGLIGYGGAAITINGSAFIGEVKAPSNVGALLGNCWTAAIVKNSFAVPSMKFCSKRAISGDSSANYSTGTETENGVTLISVQDMKGENARKVMKNLNWFRSWKTTANSFPVLNVGEYEGVEGQVWSGRLATSFAGGSGTEKDPYLISTGEQLAYLLSNILDSKGNYYKLTNDIYLNDINNSDWENENPRPWFYVSTARYGNFNGHFDGDGHVVHGMYLNIDQTSAVVYTGLFPTVSDGTVVEKTGISNAHLKVNNDNVDWQSYVGGFTGLVFFNQADEETDPDNLTVFSQCFGDSTVILDGRYAGGIVAGGPRPANIENCYFVGEVIGERVGAIIGNTWNDFKGATVTKSYGATMAEDIFCGGRSGVQNSATSYNYVDNYTNATGSVSGHAIQISLLMMRGKSAKKNMPALDFKNIWHALPNGTPVLKIFGTTDKYSNTADPDPIEISFVSNGGTECESIYGNPEDKLTLPIPEKEGYKFGGWYVYRELDIPFGIDYFPYFDQILYAKWVPLGIIQDFEGYTNSVYDLGMDYEYYRPGTVGYNAKYVRSGMASVHRIGAEDRNSDVLLNYEEMLTVGKKYNMSFWVITDKEDTSVKLSLVHEDWPDVYDSDSGVEVIKELDFTRADEWNKVEFTFIARTQWIAIRTSGLASVFFDDFMIIPDSDKIYPLEDLESDDEDDNDDNVNDQPSDDSGDADSDVSDNEQSFDDESDDTVSEEDSLTDDEVEEDVTIEEDDDDEKKETTKKVIKKIRKKRRNNNKNNHNWIIWVVVASVVVLAGASVGTIIIIKKHKLRKK